MNVRSELHCHTKMSRMSGLADVGELIRKANEMGMPAIAITDDTVQAFPEAYHVWKRISGERGDGTKVILGIEAQMGGAKVIILPKNSEGMRELYDIISEVSFEMCGNSRIPKSILAEKRKGFIIGCCAQGGEVYHAVTGKQSDEEIGKIMGFYDFVEVEPVTNYSLPHCPETKADINEYKKQIKEDIRRIVRIGQEKSVPVIASANVHYVNKEDAEPYKVLRKADGWCREDGWDVRRHLMSTAELLDEFDFLGEKTAKEIVVNNPNRVAAELGVVQPISDEKQYPVYPDANSKLKGICYKNAHEIYGDKLPDEVKKRLEDELTGIRENEGFASLYMIEYELVKKSNEAGYIVGTRGCSGASFVSFLAGISQLNPLPAHYLCKNCKHTDFDVLGIKGYHPGDLGLDLPDKKCPVCGAMLSKEGFDFPIETFLGLHFDREPYFSKNFATEYQHEAQCKVADIEGVGRICRAGNPSTVTERQAVEYVKRYFKEKNSKISKEDISKIAKRLVGVKSDDGARKEGVFAIPNGVELSRYTPLNGESDDIAYTMFDFFSLDEKLLNVNIIAHDGLSFLRYLSDETGVDPREIKFGDDEKVLSLFSGTKALGIRPDEIKGITVGTIGVSEYSRHYGALRLLELVRPKRNTDVLKVLCMLQSSLVWFDDFEMMLQSSLAGFDDFEMMLRENPEGFVECISCRDDIMLYLISKGMKREEAYAIMECVRRGRGRLGLKEEWITDMRNAGVPDRYIESCEKIRYLFPKAHCADYALMAWRLLYYKLYYPEAFYKGWIKYNDAEALVEKGYEYAATTYEKLAVNTSKKPGDKQRKLMDECLVILEMHARGIKVKEDKQV